MKQIVTTFFWLTTLLNLIFMTIICQEINNEKSESLTYITFGQILEARYENWNSHINRLGETIMALPDFPGCNIFDVQTLPKKSRLTYDQQRECIYGQPQLFFTGTCYSKPITVKSEEYRKLVRWSCSAVLWRAYLIQSNYEKGVYAQNTHRMYALNELDKIGTRLVDNFNKHLRKQTDDNKIIICCDDIIESLNWCHECIIDKNIMSLTWLNVGLHTTIQCPALIAFVSQLSSDKKRIIFKS